MTVTTRRATAGALAAYSGVVIALTMLKAFYRIGYLWDPANQVRRDISLAPFSDLIEAKSWFGPLFGYGGNIAFFVPVGVLAFILFERTRRPVLAATLLGAGFSLLIEISQYVFSLGYSDIDDLLMNTLGAFVGAKIAQWCGSRMYKVWIGLTYGAVFLFISLVLAGEPRRPGEN
nr:teicoplanin resistance protein [Streptococcus thermophilus]